MVQQITAPVQPVQVQQTVIRREFIVERDGRQFVLYAGVLDAAHDQGLQAITTELLQVPADGNGFSAIVRAVVVTARGTFTGIGDAAPNNVTAPMRTALIRMAETRAKARALRDAVNVGTAALEELGDEGQGGYEVDEDGPIVPAQQREREPRRLAAVREQGQPAATRPAAGPGPATAAQLNAIARIAGGAAKGDEEARRRFDGRPAAELTRREASTLIEALKNGAAA